MELARLGVAHQERDADLIGDLVALCSAHAPAPSGKAHVQLARVSAHLAVRNGGNLGFVRLGIWRESGRSEEAGHRLGGIGRRCEQAVERAPAGDLHGLDAKSPEAPLQAREAVADKHGPAHAQPGEALQVGPGEAPGSAGGKGRLASGRDRGQGVEDALCQHDLVFDRALVEDPARHAGGEQDRRVVVVRGAPGAQPYDLAPGRAHRHDERSHEVLVARAPVDAERDQALAEVLARFAVALGEPLPEGAVREPEREALGHRRADPET